MFRLSYLIHNPRDAFHEASIIFGVGRRLTQHKSIDFSILKSNSIIGCGVSFTTRRDHAGLDLDLNFLGFDVNVNIYDNRHWDREANDWEK
jgi:hypothetical protein